MGKTLRVKKSFQYKPRMIPSEGKHTRTLIYLHGMDSTPLHCKGRGVRDTPLNFPGLRVVLPGAEWMYVDAYEEEMVSWFDITWKRDWEKTGNVRVVPASLRAATDRIVAVVLREVERVGAENVYLGGISMGMMMGLHVLMDARLPALGGFVGIVGDLLDETIARAMTARAARRRVPIRCFFGENDKLVPPALGRKLLRRLKAHGFDVADMTIPNAGHNAVVVEKTGLRNFFGELIPEAVPRRLQR